MTNLILVIILTIVLYMFYYLVKSVYKLKYFDKINNKFFRVVISIILLSLLFLLFKFTDAFIIYIHLAIFLLLCNILFYFINKKKSKKNKYHYETIFFIALLITTIYMSIGLYQAYHVWETKYEIYTDKNIGADNFRIAQISDAHLGTTFNGDGFKKHIDRISNTNPDILVITGDFVDDDTKYVDMIKACEALGEINPKYGKYFVYGNHDRGYYNSRDFDVNELIKDLQENGVTVLNDEVVEINEYIYLIGRLDKSMYGRKEISELTTDLDKNKYIIDLNHQPNDYDNESRENIDLVLSGHSHGGQLFPLGIVGIMINANDAYKGMKKINNTTFIVNTGISDWSMHFKTGTKSEYTIIDIKNN